MTLIQKKSLFVCIVVVFLTITAIIGASMNQVKPKEEVMVEIKNSECLPNKIVLSQSRQLLLINRDLVSKSISDINEILLTKRLREDDFVYLQFGKSGIFEFYCPSGTRNKLVVEVK